MTLYQVDKSKATDMYTVDGFLIAVKALIQRGVLVEAELAPRLQDDPEWPIRWCPVHCCGSVDTFPERYERTGMQGRCYLGVEFDEDCELVVVEVVVVEDTE